MSIVQSDRIADLLSKLPKAIALTREAQNGYRERQALHERENRTAYWHHYRTIKPINVRAYGTRNDLRRSIEKAIAGSDVTEQAIHALREVTKACHYCRKPLACARVAMDHVIPLSKGGLHMMANIVGCCRNCNSRKSNKLNWKPEPWDMWKP